MKKAKPDTSSANKGGTRTRGRGKKPGARNRPNPKVIAQQRAFLAQFAEIGVVTAAANVVGIKRKLHYEWLADAEKYPQYRAQFEDACEQAADCCEQEMMRRGVQGWEEPVYGKLPGKDSGTGIVGSRPMYSDRMLELALKARRPEKFRERFSTELTGKGGGPVAAEVLFYLPQNGREK